MTRAVCSFIPPTTVERYFSLHFAPQMARLLSPRATHYHYLEDVCIARHHNGICLVCLSPLHPIIAAKKSITNISYRVDMQKVSGKRKHGALVAEPVTRLCTITCADGDAYSVQCCVGGRLIEYNDALSENYQLVNSKPLSDGYLAVLLPFASKLVTATDHLLTRDEYDAFCDAKPVDKQCLSLIPKRRPEKTPKANGTSHQVNRNASNEETTNL